MKRYKNKNKDTKNTVRKLDINSFLEEYNKSKINLIKYLNCKKDYESVRILNEDNIVSIPFIDNMVQNKFITINGLYEIMIYMRSEKNAYYCLSEFIENPYNFIKPHLTTFRLAEKINQHYQLHTNFETRCEYWLYSYFRNNNQYYIKNYNIINDLSRELEFGNKLTQFTNYDIPSSIDYKQIIDTKCSKKKINGVEYNTIDYLYDIENECTELILKNYCSINVDNDEIEITPKLDDYYDKNTVNEFIKKYENDKDFKLVKDQIKAIHNSINNKFSVICGPPGTGKSTITDIIIDYIYELNPNFNISLMAPTGLAVKSLKNKCNVKSDNLVGTCHKMRHVLKDPEMKNIQKLDVVIIDEISMLGVNMFKILLKLFEKYNCKLIILGDHNQLPSIDHGNVLTKIIDSDLFTISFLKEIKRQSGVLMKNIIRMLDGKKVTTKHFDNESITMVPDNYFVENFKLSKKQLKKFIDLQGLNVNNSRFITPQHKHMFGCLEMNTILQSIFNRGSKIIKKSNGSNTSFKYGDKIVRIKNDYKSDELYANGDTGVVDYYIEDKPSKVGSSKKDEISLLEEKIMNSLSVTDNNDNTDYVQINYDNGKTEKIFTDCLNEEFELAYCTTIHKAQGSQYENVILFMHNDHNYSWSTSGSRNLLYTAISRSQKRCFIIGTEEMFIKAQSVKTVPNPSLFLEDELINRIIY